MFSDVISLGELQLKLLKRDTTETIERTYVSAAILLAGVLVLLACLPVGMFAAVHLLHETLDTSIAMSFAIVVAASFSVGVMVTAIGFIKLKKAGNSFRRSQSEFSKNVDWLKQTLKRR